MLLTRSKVIQDDGSMARPGSDLSFSSSNNIVSCPDESIILMFVKLSYPALTLCTNYNMFCFTNSTEKMLTIGTLCVNYTFSFQALKQCEAVQIIISFTSRYDIKYVDTTQHSRTRRSNYITLNRTRNQ